MVEKRYKSLTHIKTMLITTIIAVTAIMSFPCITKAEGTAQGNSDAVIKQGISDTTISQAVSSNPSLTAQVAKVGFKTVPQLDNEYPYVQR